MVDCIHSNICKVRRLKLLLDIDAAASPRLKLRNCLSLAQLSFSKNRSGLFCIICSPTQCHKHNTVCLIQQNKLSFQLRYFSFGIRIIELKYAERVPGASLD